MNFDNRTELKAWAVVVNGEIDFRSLGLTRTGAMRNWLYYSHLVASNCMGPEEIEQRFDRQVAAIVGGEVRVTSVNITAS